MKIGFVPYMGKVSMGETFAVSWLNFRGKANIVEPTISLPHSLRCHSR